MRTGSTATMYWCCTVRFHTSPFRNNPLVNLGLFGYLVLVNPVHFAVYRQQSIIKNKWTFFSPNASSECNSVFTGTLKHVCRVEDCASNYVHTFKVQKKKKH